MRTEGIYNGEEIDVVFSCSWEKSDNGVDGPYYRSWHEPVDFEIEEVTILGVTVQEKDLPKKLQEALYDLVDEVDFERD